MKLVRPKALMLVAAKGAVLLTFVWLAGCSSLFGSSAGKAREPSKLQEFKASVAPQIRWHEDLGDADGNVLQPTVTSDAVYAANAKGELYRLDSTTGKQRWMIKSGFRITGGVGAGEGLELVGGSKGDVAAFDQEGKLLWKIKVSSEVLSAPQVSSGIVVVRTGDGRIVGLNVKDGARLWLYERATPALIVRSHTGVSIEHGIVFAGFAGGKLALINLTTGIVMWEATVSQPRGNTELERISDITSVPVADEEQVCAVAFQGSVACFDLAQGNSLWSRDVSSDKGVVLSRKYLYITDADGVISALDKTSGSSLWKNDKLSFRQASKPFVLGNTVAVGDFEGYVHLLNRDDGGFVARFKTDGSSIVATPIALDDGLLVQTSKGGLYSVTVH